MVATSIRVVHAHGVGAGHALVIGVYTSSSASPAITSSVGTPVTEYSDLADAGASTWMNAAILANTASGSITITATTTPSAYTNIWISVTEYSNVAASPLDTDADYAPNGGYGSSSISTGNFTTTASGDMLWSMCSGLGQYAAFYAGTVPITWTAVNSYEGGNIAPWIFVENGLAGSPGTYYGQCATNTTTYGGGAARRIIMTLAIKASTPTASTPTFSPVAGSYSEPQTVTISTTTPSSTIYYTTDGTMPTTSSTAYSTPIIVAAYETVEAITVSSGYSNSEVGSAAYLIGVATPTFSPVAGSYTGTQSVTIGEATGGASIYYTTNGTAPTTNSMLYSGAISVSAAETLEAIGAEAGYSNSAVASAAYDSYRDASHSGGLVDV